jgi:hypothetical protein
MQQRFFIRCLFWIRPQTGIVSPIDFDFMSRGQFRPHCFGWLFPLEAPQPRNCSLPLARKLVPSPSSDEDVRNNNKDENCAQCNVPGGGKNIDHGFHQPTAGSAILWQRPAHQEQDSDGENTGQAREIDFVN